MATNIEEISRFLSEAKDLNFSPVADPNILATRFHTESYVDTDGNRFCAMVIATEEDGRFLKVMVPLAYHFPKDANSYNKLALFQTLLQISWQTKMVQFEYDADEGYVSAIIEFPLEDSQLTQRQLLRCIYGMVETLDRHHEQIVDAMRLGLTPETDQQRRAAFEEFQKLRREERRRNLGA